MEGLYCQFRFFMFGHFSNNKGCSDTMKNELKLENILEEYF